MKISGASFGRPLGSAPRWHVKITIAPIIILLDTRRSSGQERCKPLRAAPANLVTKSVRLVIVTLYCDRLPQPLSLRHSFILESTLSARRSFISSLHEENEARCDFGIDRCLFDDRELFGS